MQLINPSTSSNELNTTLTPHSITHGDACFAYFNKIWGIPYATRNHDYMSPIVRGQKQVMRAQECRQLQNKLVGDQPLTPERGEEIAKTMNRNGCSAGASTSLLCILSPRAFGQTRSCECQAI